MDRERDRKTVDADDAVRQAYEGGEPTENTAYRDLTEPVSSADQLAGKREPPDDRTASLSGGDVDTALQDLEAGIETPGGSNPTPDQDVVDEIGASVGVTYQDDEPLKFGEKMAARDERRWELDPASSDDYQERRQADVAAQRGSGKSRRSETPAPRRAAPKPRRSGTSPRTAEPRGGQAKASRKAARSQATRSDGAGKSRKQAAVGGSRSKANRSRTKAAGKPKAGSRPGSKQTGKRSRS